MHSRLSFENTPTPQRQLPHYNCSITSSTSNLNILDKCRCKVHQQLPNNCHQQLLQHHHSEFSHPHYKSAAAGVGAAIQNQSLTQFQLQHQTGNSPSIANNNQYCHHPHHQQHLHHHHHHYHHHHQTFVATASSYTTNSTVPLSSSVSGGSASSTTTMYRRHNNLSYCGVSAQDAGQNYQVQYLDTELYHSNSSQTQMAYPFCPVGDYQTNGQTYYSTTSNYGAANSASAPTTHTSTLPYLVPVDESILLNSSSQSHSRDSPHSMTEVAYIHEAQSTPQTPTSTSTTNSVSGGSMGTGGADGSPDCESNIGNNNKISSATIKWLSRNYETADGVSLPRSTLYNHYMQHCNESKLEPVNAASFGKLIRSVFSGLRTRRLGTRGNSKYHYYGIRIKPNSHLNSLMDEKPIYITQNNHHNHHHHHHHNMHNGNSNAGAIANNGGSGSNVSSSSPSTSNATTTNRIPKKLTFKADTYETCAQFLGDGAGAIPSFPPIEIHQTFATDYTMEDIEKFRALYRDHCESFLDAIMTLEFHTIEFLWRDFWRAGDNNNLNDCDDEKYLSKTKLYMLCHCAEVQKFVRDVDYQFYQNIVDVIIPDVLRSIPNTLTQAIRNFSKNLEIWLCEAMAGVPERLVQIKSSAVSAFCQTLRRYTSLNHLAQAARAVLQNNSQISQMLNDLNRVDFHSVQEQAAWVCDCELDVVQRLENDFKAALQQHNTLEQWASWLQLVVDSTLLKHHGKSTYPKAARQFLLNWSFYSSMVIRDLTLRSASSFGSFHLIRLLYDEYMFYLVEHKIAEALQKTAIAVICDRMNRDLNINFDFEEYINDCPPKRMKQE